MSSDVWYITGVLVVSFSKQDWDRLTGIYCMSIFVFSFVSFYSLLFSYLARVKHSVSYRLPYFIAHWINKNFVVVYIREFVVAFVWCRACDAVGLQVGDELLVLNGLVISQLDMVYVEALLDELDAISLTVRSCRPVDRACPVLSSPPSDELVDTPSTQPMWMQHTGNSSSYTTWWKPGRGP